MSLQRWLCIAALGIGLLPYRGLGAQGLDGNVRQLIVGYSADWNASHGHLRTFERDAQGRWKAVSAPVPVLFGKNGLVWGRGLVGTDLPGAHKVERDGRSPAGIFKIGRIYTYDQSLPTGSDYPFHQLTNADAWVDDPALPNYNRFVTIPDLEHPPDWFEKAKMRQGDFAYRWLVEIRHNADPPVAGAGSAIFFHIRRGENRPTSGCTSMAEPELVKLIRWLRSDDHPCYALLPMNEYRSHWQSWGLPEPSALETAPGH